MLGVPISLLDVVPITGDETAEAGLERAAVLARQADGLGYVRLWYAEHHNMPGIGSTAPEVLTARAASITERISVGSGGVMLPNHAPLTVAERWATLEALFPGRIDLGVGRAPGTDQRTAQALRRGPGSEDLDAQLAKLLGHMHGFPPGHPLDGLTAYPRPRRAPRVFVLGSSDYGARLAALRGLPYAFAHHFSSRYSAPAMHLYRDGFQPSEVQQRPHAILTVTVVCADTDERAHELASAWALSFVRLRSGLPPRPFPSHVEVAAHRWSPAERQLADQVLAAQAIGSPGTVERRLGELIEMTGADELMATMPITEPDARQQSLAALAQIA
jgi:luciferase family oxidoreductase group 1